MNNKYMMMANQLMSAGYMPQSMAKPMGMPQQQMGMQPQMAMPRGIPFDQEMQSMGQPIQQPNEMMGPMRGIMGGRNFGLTRNIRS